MPERSPEVKMESLPKPYFMAGRSDKVHTKDCIHILGRTGYWLTRKQVEEIFPASEDCKVCGGCGGL